MISNFLKQFGGSISKADKERFSQSKNWNGKMFENLEETAIDVNLITAPQLIRDNIRNRKNRDPKQELPIIPFDKETFEENDNNQPKFVWYGHSVVLLRINKTNILIDPMFGQDASAISPLNIQRFSKNTLEIIDDLPQIDVVLMSHDHYDHLDLESYEKLRGKVNQFIVPLGVGRHLKAWRFDESIIKEADWWDNFMINNIKITFTPSRHFSGRGLFDRTKSLWGGWAFNTKTFNIYHTGDGGYGKHFKEIGEKLGPFDFTFSESGQYYKLWHQIHMMPEESVQVAKDVNTKMIMPIHWAAFSLALHNWKSSVDRFMIESEVQNIHVCTPKLGEIVTIGNDYPTEKWWETFE